MTPMAKLQKSSLLVYGGSVEGPGSIWASWSGPERQRAVHSRDSQLRWPSGGPDGAGANPSRSRARLPTAEWPTSCLRLADARADRRQCLPSERRVHAK